METAGQDLMREHEAIIKALNIIEKMFQMVNDDKITDPEDIKEIIDFLKVFADKCHHAKEEKYLFPALESVGIRNENGPIGVMLEQHRKGRELIKQMEAALTEKSVNKDLFTEAASSYVFLLRDHIQKENTVLFPISDAKLSATQQKELLSRFDELERTVIGEGIHEELHKVLEKLGRKYLS